MSLMTSLHCSSSGESVLFLAWKNSDSEYSLGFQNDHTKRRQDVPHFGLKYLNNVGINRDCFTVKIFYKYILLGQLENHRVLILSGGYL